jgi:hypothetical protein
MLDTSRTFQISESGFSFNGELLCSRRYPDTPTLQDALKMTAEYIAAETGVKVVPIAAELPKGKATIHIAHLL